MAEAHYRILQLFFGLVFFIGMLSACAPGTPPESEEPLSPVSDTALLATPKGWEPIAAPANNPVTPEKVALGHQLFFDKRLSADGTRSCYSCHLNENGLTDGKRVAEGALGKVLTRSSPTLWNVGYQTEFYWDGRSTSLEAQAKAAWTGGNMGADADKVVTTLNSIDDYRTQFESIFGESATPENVVAAISAYERASLFCADTAYDRWLRGDETAVSASTKRGAELFAGEAGCGNCHSGVLFTDMKYHNVGIGMKNDEPDLGRHRVTEEDVDRGAFKTPTLRDISRSGPYFHNGSVDTLEEAVELMVNGGIDNPHIDRENLQPKSLSDEQKVDLVAFLRSLDCGGSLETPELPQ